MIYSLDVIFIEIGIIDVLAHFNALKAAWIPKLMCKTEKEHWKEILLEQINKLGSNLYDWNFSTPKNNAQLLTVYQYFTNKL